MTVVRGGARARRPGLGLVGQTDDGASVDWDRHYHVTLLSDLRTRGLLDRARPRAGHGLDRHQGRLLRRRPDVRDDDALEFLRFPPLGLVDKVRLGATILLRLPDPRRPRRWRTCRCCDWLRRWSGPAHHRDVLAAAAAGEARRATHTLASAAFIWATIQRLYAARRAGLKTRAVRLRPRRLRPGARRVRRAPRGRGRRACRPAPRCRPCAAAEAATARVDVHRRRGGATFDRRGRHRRRAAGRPALPGPRAGERARLDGVRYQGIVCASLVLTQPLAPYYLTYITDPGRRSPRWSR